MIERVLETIGGVVTIIAGLVDIVLRHPLDYYLYKFNALSGSVLVYLGILGIIAGLMILYGGFKDKRDFVIAGSAIGVGLSLRFHEFVFNLSSSFPLSGSPRLG
ncbi:MAG: hypothetical protein RXR43_16800 [Sulfolobus sp.]